MPAAAFVRTATLLSLLALAACATVNEAPVVDLSTDPGTASPSVREPAPVQPRTATPGEHVVAGGDTLYGIAFRHGVDYRSLADWNRIPPPFTIRPGQVLRLRAPEPAPDAPVARVPAAPSRAADTPAAQVELPGDTVVLAAPDPADAPPEGEARTYGIDDGGAAPARMADDAPPVDPARGTAPSSTPTGPPAQPTPRPLSAAPAPAAASSAEPLRPAPDGAMPPPMTWPGAGAARPAAPATAATPPPARPAGALARAVAEPAPASPPPAPATPAPPLEPAAPRAAAAEPSPAPANARIAEGPSRTAGGVRWRWPAEGTLVNRFAAGDPARQGIDLRGRAGAPVLAAADGEVVYSGNGLVGYGELIIIKHSAEFLSAYGHNRRRLVAEGQRVKAGQAIAEMGRAPNGFDALHFEIRRAGRPTDPLQFLPPR
jgi:lipoprotein NlpD